MKGFAQKISAGFVFGARRQTNMKKSYEQLKKIADEFVLEGDDIPKNPFLLSKALHIPYKFSNASDPTLNGCPAALVNNGGDGETKPIIYIDSSSKFWQFYMFHEISHFLLKHRENNAENEYEANLLACLLICPHSQIPPYLKSAGDLASFAQIPIGRAEEYWEHAKPKKAWISPCKDMKFDDDGDKDESKNNGKNNSVSLKKFIIGAVAVIICSTISCITWYMGGRPDATGFDGITETDGVGGTSSVSDMSSLRDTNSENGIYADGTGFKNTASDGKDANDNAFYVTPHGKKYHKKDCKYIKNKKGVMKVESKEILKNYLPCSVCIMGEN